MTEPPAPFAAAIADRYRLDREIGRGGMATVYLAHDLRHDRPVALKLLHPDLAASLGPERFQREIRLAARLQHPNILGVYDSGSDAGYLWFTMPFVEGESLRDRLNRERQLPIEDATRIAREAADALHYAHQHGIVHRDIKPENLLLSSGHALVADFGIARAVGGSEAALTGTGLVVGTPAYMPPEQATGERELDARSDIYALGCVLYEMLAGEAPFTGPTAQAILSRSLSETPRPIRATRPALSAAIDQVVSQAMARVPADRHATAEQFGRALAQAAPEARTSGETQATASTSAARRRPRVPLLAVLGVGVLLGAGALFAWRSQDGTTAPAGPPAVAVLPFENLGAADDEYFADGITDEVRGRLAALPSLQVIASASASQYKKTTKTPAQVANELGVRYLLVGKVRWEKSGRASRVRVSPELIEIARGRPARTVWQQPFDADLTDVFKVQGDIAAQVAQALNVAIGSTERQQLGERPTTNLAAYDAYLKAEETGAIASGDVADLRRAVQYYGQAVALDSTFAVAWARLGQTQATLYVNGTPDPTLAASAFRAADRAVALAPNRPEGYVARGVSFYNIRRDNAGAEGPLRRALEISPNNSEAFALLATAKMGQGQWEEALKYFGDATRLDPRSVGNARRYARALLWLRRYPEALPAAERALALAPSTFQILEGKAMVYLGQGDLAGARQVLGHPPKPVEPASFVAYMATFWDLYWVLDDEQQRLLLRLPASAFDDNRAAMAIARAQTLWIRGDKAGARVWADTARIEYGLLAKAAPGDAQSQSFIGLSYGYLGRKAEALSHAEAGTRLTSIEQDGFIGPYQVHLLARTAILVGDYDRALDALDRLLKIPYFLSPGWLRIDPAFDPLRGNPRFEALVAGPASH